MMNGVFRSAFKLATLKTIPNSLKQNVTTICVKRQLARTLWTVCSKNEDRGVTTISKPNILSKCGCGGSCKLHTKSDISGENELVEFLTDEISTEKGLRKSQTIPSEIDGYQVHLDGSDVSLTKELNDEKIEITFSINHSVSSVPDIDENPTLDKEDSNEMKSRPQFDIHITRGKKVLAFTCSYLEQDAAEPQNEEEYADLFSIDEIALYEGEWKETNYAVSGDILDGYLYDLLMNYLEEKGISNDFVEKMSDLSSLYEHNSYINLLADLQKFAAGK